MAVGVVLHCIAANNCCSLKTVEALQTIDVLLLLKVPSQIKSVNDIE